MEKCSIGITSKSEGKTKRYSLQGECERADGKIRLSYLQEGDAVTLLLDEKQLVMTRVGAVRLTMTFAEGVQTALVLQGECSRGEVAISTKKYRLVQRENGLFFVCDYQLLYPDAPERFSLKAQVNTIEREC